MEDLAGLSLKPAAHIRDTPMASAMTDSSCAFERLDAQCCLTAPPRARKSSASESGLLDEERFV